VNLLGRVGAVVLLAAGTTQAGGLTGSVSLLSDYDFRGVTQSARRPALQASLDWAAGNGIELGLWASNVDFGDCCGESVEVDLSGRWTRGDREQGWALDLFGIWYGYPGADDVDFPELSVGVAWRWVEARLWYSWDFGASGESATYVEANLAVPLPLELGLTAHAGHSDGGYWTDPAFGGRSYRDWSVGLERSFGPVALSVRWVDGSDCSAAVDGGGDVLSCTARVVAGVSTTLPWG
jgi:uncharacterized protein (TIGR02001 family)